MKFQKTLIPLFSLLLILVLHNTEILKNKKHLKHSNRQKSILHLKQETKNELDSNPNSLEVLPSSTFDGKSSFQDFQKALKDFHLSHGELRAVFRIADKNHDGVISGYEWQAFYSLFVSPFKSCSQDQDNLISESELSKCVQSDQLKASNLTDADGDKIFEAFFKSPSAKQLNLADYLFLRRVNLGWKECGVDGLLSQINIRCALEISVPGKRVEFYEEKSFFDVTLTLKNGVKNNLRSSITFMEFLEVAYIYYFFHEFEIPFTNTGELTKNDLIRAINDQVLPNTFSKQTIEQMYGEFKSYDFPSFACSFWALKLFQKYSQISDNKLVQDEFLNLLQDRKIPRLLLQQIDGFYSPSQQEIDALNKNNNQQLTEKDFFINPAFLQFGLKEEQYNDQPNVDNRKLVFTIFEDNSVGNMTFVNLLKFFKVSWLFLNYDSKQAGNITQDEINYGMKNYHSCLPLTEDEFKHLNQILDFVSSSRRISINIKLFWTFFTYENLFPNLRIMNSNNHCTFAKLKEGTDKLGLKISKVNRGLSQEGADVVFKEPTYNWRYCFKNCIEEEALALKYRANNVQLLSENNANLGPSLS